MFWFSGDQTPTAWGKTNQKVANRNTGLANRNKPVQNVKTNQTVAGSKPTTVNQKATDAKPAGKPVQKNDVKTKDSEW